MSYSLVVIKPFAAYRHGAAIHDATQIAAILASSKRHNVVRVLGKHKPAAPEPAAVESAPESAAPAGSLEPAAPVSFEAAAVAE